MVFRTDESVMFMEVSLIQRCPDREVPLGCSHKPLLIIWYKTSNKNYHGGYEFC